jgi:hypothetical protein
MFLPTQLLSKNPRMRRVRSALGLACILASCALPPRVDDRTTPVGAYETFRGAIARGEYDREWSCLSDGMRKSLGIANRGQWEDARTVVLTKSHILVRGICLSDVAGEPKALPDGRVLLELDFPLGYEGRVVLRPGVRLRAWVADSPEPVVLEPLDKITLKWRKNDGVLVEVPEDAQRWIEPELARPIVRFEVVTEWFLDDFAAGDETPKSVSKALAEKAENKEPGP